SRAHSCIRDGDTRVDALTSGTVSARFRETAMSKPLASGALKTLALGIALSAGMAHASSHREALAVLNEPCADNTDTYAWVKPGTHDKLYLIANFNPLHEPGQGNQGLRACNGYRYEFHIARDASLDDKFVYRLEFNASGPTDGKPGPNDPPPAANELPWQTTGGPATSTVT